MVTKKGVQKKAAKAAKPAKKAPAGKTAEIKKNVKPVNKKAASKSHAPAVKAAAKKVQPAAVKKHVAAATSKKSTTPAKSAGKSPSKHTPEKEVEPVKKPAVGADTHQEVKPSIKPLTKPASKPETPKSQKVVVPHTSTSKTVKYEPDFTKSVLDAPLQDQNVPTMRYSDTELGEFRDLIMKKLDTAKKELAYLQGLITRKDESGDLDEGRYMTMEDGSMSMEREQLSQMASRQIQFIDHLEKALMRIENKTYGICRVTGKLIEKARLRAVPHATLSMEAKQMRK